MFSVQEIRRKKLGKQQLEIDTGLAEAEEEDLKRSTLRVRKLTGRSKTLLQVPERVFYSHGTHSIVSEHIL